MIITTTITSINKATRESSTRTFEPIRAESVSLPDGFVLTGEGEWVMATETHLSVHQHSVKVTH